MSAHVEDFDPLAPKSEPKKRATRRRKESVPAEDTANLSIAPEMTPEEVAAKLEADTKAQEEFSRRFGFDLFILMDDGSGRQKKHFLSQTTAETVMEQVSMALGIDSRMWVYRSGVWKPEKDIITDRVSGLLGEAFQKDHAGKVEAHIHRMCREQDLVIKSEPVEHLINFKNGYLDWRTGGLLPHTPDVLSTVQLNTEWDPDATCPEFDNFLASVVPADTIDMVWELIGYLMYSGNPLHKAVMLMGKGRNGKGTFLRVLTELLGKENTTAVTLDSLANERFAPAGLFGKLANIAGDIDAKYMESTARFKAITGEDQITAEHKGKDPFDFTPWAVPVFSANKIPGSADVTTGYMSRWLVVPFPNDFAGKEDRGLSERISTPAELRGIAAKAVPALQRVLERGNFPMPDGARAAFEEFERRVDQVRSFLDEATERVEGADVSRKVLYDQYKYWAKDTGCGQLRAAEFYDRLEAAGLRLKMVRGQRMVEGLTLSGPDAFSVH